MTRRALIAVPAMLLLTACGGDDSKLLDPSDFTGRDAVYVEGLNDYWRSLSAEEATQMGRDVCDGFGTPGFNPHTALVGISGKGDADNLVLAAIDAYCPNRISYVFPVG